MTKLSIQKQTVGTAGNIHITNKVCQKYASYGNEISTYWAMGSYSRVGWLSGY